MYGLPEDFDATIFLGKRLDSICFAQFVVSFYFDDDLSVSIESSFLVSSGAEQAAIKQSPPVLSSSAMELIGKKVTEAKPHRDGTLLLRFENKASLSFLDDKAQYESYVIKSPAMEVIV